MWDVQLFELNYNEREIEAAKRVIAGGWITMGEKTRQFEEKFAAMLGGNIACVATSSATAALHMALLALNIGPGDEVIIPAQTFVADVNVVCMVGARPVLADSASLTDWNISAETIERCITPRTKAVIAVHFAGFPIMDIEAIAQLCYSQGIALIEDAAHAPGARIGKAACGTIGDIGCFSFFTNKNLSIGEGGMAVSANADLVGALRLLRSHGMTAPTLDRFKGRSASYDIARAGLNYRIDEIRAAIGLVQMDKLPEANARRAELFARYRANLESTPLLIPFADHDARSDITPAHHIMPVLLPAGSDRPKIIEQLKDAGIQTSIHYPPFWEFSAFAGQFRAEDTPVAAEICARELTLPLFPAMTEAQVDMVTATLENVLT